MEKDYYKILEVERNATDKEIKDSFRRLSKKYHPDRNNGSKEAEEKFKQIAEAYEVLSNKEMRERYDTYGTVDDGFNFSGGGINPEDFFNDFMRRHGFGFDDEPQEKTYKGQDKVLRINVSFEDVYNGATKTVSYNVSRPCKKCNGSGSKDGKIDICPHCNGEGRIHNRQRFGMMFTDNITICPYCGGVGKAIKNKCSECGGSGLVETKETLTVNVPTIDKVLQQSYIRRGSGHSCTNNLGVNGDLRFTFNLAPTEEYNLDTQNALNIVKTVKVPIIDCLLGTTLSVKHLDGKSYTITLDECTPDGREYRISGKGFKVGSYCGDLLIRIKHVMPQKLTSDERKILNKLKKK